MIEYQCPHCGTSLKIPDEQAGFPGECSHCDGRITVPFPIGDLAPPVSRKADSRSSSDKRRIECECPHCGKELKIRRESAGKAGKCNHCGGMLTVPIPVARFVRDESSSEPPPIPSESPPDIDFCPDCGLAIPKGTKSCPHCEKEIKTRRPEPRDKHNDKMAPCRICEEFVAIGASACPHCGIDKPTAPKLELFADGVEKVSKNISSVLTGIIVIILGMGILSCAGLFTDIFGGDSAENDSYSSAESVAIQAVKNSITEQRNAMGTFRAAPLKGGIAVLSSRDWAYWVKDGVVYNANGLAMSASPKNVTTLPGIGFDSVERAVNGR